MRDVPRRIGRAPDRARAPRSPRSKFGNRRDAHAGTEPVPDGDAAHGPVVEIVGCPVVHGRQIYVVVIVEGVTGVSHPGRCVWEVAEPPRPEEPPSDGFPRAVEGAVRREDRDALADGSHASHGRAGNVDMEPESLPTII